MRPGRLLIQRYIIAAIIPYLLMALLLLTAILLAQQSGRLAEILVVARVPTELLAEFSLSLIPNVLVFALPTAMLVGVLVGLSRMGTDSELVAMRAAGIGTWQMLWPVLLLGCLLTVAALCVNLSVAPEAARTLRRASIRAALYKMDSPVEPRTFNTEIPGYVIYVKDGDKVRGQWGRVFLFAQQKDGLTRLVTARSGRIDSSAERSELVLTDAISTTFPAKEGQGTAARTTERLEQLRFVLDTGRKELLGDLQKEEARPEEMYWSELLTPGQTPRESRERLTLAHRRLAFSMGPMVFALLGAGLGLRVRKGGRGFGLLLSLAVLLVYYLLSLFGEQMARTGAVPVVAGTWMANLLTTVWAMLLLLKRRGSLKVLRLPNILRRAAATESHAKAVGLGSTTRAVSGRPLGFPSLLDKTVIRTVTLSFTTVLTALTALILVFTLFELWKWIVERGTGARTVLEYLLYLLPFVGVQLASPSMLVAVLVSYALMARRSEAIAWWACGQSVFRLALPGLFTAIFTGMLLWGVQERLMPAANLRQDALRAQIRTGTARASTQSGRLWLASTETGRIYSYIYDGTGRQLDELFIYEFDPEGIHLSRIIKGETADWNALGGMVLEGVDETVLEGLRMTSRQAERLEMKRSDSIDLFKPWADKPSQLSAKDLSAYIKTIRRKGEAVAPLMVALQRKYADPFGVIVMALVGIPLALAFGRRSAIAALSSAVAVGLTFWGVTSGSQQMGVYGFLPPAVAAWAPVVIFGATGTYLLARSRT
ncbi:MAG TPA: LptF/LptG family permease [Pyrinomonadaceae bacterium]|jgi:LPS export ABC transporter permease LptF/LPS export ABC transporter permease LptG